MTLRRLKPGERLNAARGAVVVVVAEPEVAYLAATSSDQEVVLVEPGVTAMNAAIDACAEADIALIEAGIVAADGWLARLADAARSDSTVATASPFGATEVDVERAAKALATRSPRARPRVATCATHAVYLRRNALELVGPLDERYESVAEALCDFSRRCLERGLQHVLADDVLVGGGPRFPVLDAGEELVLSGALIRATAAVRRAKQDLDVTLDLRLIASELSGAQIHVLEIVSALARRGGARLGGAAPRPAAPTA
jgi:hypothetical protein